MRSTYNNINASLMFVLQIFVYLFICMSIYSLIHSFIGIKEKRQALHCIASFLASNGMEPAAKEIRRLHWRLLRSMILPCLIVRTLL